MKTTLQAAFVAAILLCALVSINLTVSTAQTYIPRILGSLPTENNHPNFKDSNVYDRNYWLSRPIIGWNWGGNGANLDNAFHARVLHSKFLYATQWYGQNYQNYAAECFNAQLIPDSSRFIMYLDFDGASGNSPADTLRKYYSPLYNNIAQQIEPTITIQENLNFIPRPADREGGVFGFKNKNKVRLLTDTTAFDYGRVLFDKDSVSLPTLVLSKLWRPNVLRYIAYGEYATTRGKTPAQGGTPMDTLRSFEDAVGFIDKPVPLPVPRQIAQDARDSVNGRIWRLSINLRSRESIPANLRDSVILSIRLPIVIRDPKGDTVLYAKPAPNPPDTLYVPTYSSGVNIRFSRFSGGDTVSIVGDRGDYRGLCRNLTVNANGATVWNITGAMLALGSGTQGDSSITLTAEFICDDDTTFPVLHNKMFTPELQSRGVIKKPDDKKFIDSIDIELRYHGKLNVAVDWLRFETPHSQQLFRGRRDNLFRDMIIAMENFWTARLNVPPFAARNLRVINIYGIEERNALWWWHNRYQNQLTDGLTIDESKPYFDENAAHALHAKGYPNYWTGVNIALPSDVAAPYYRYGNTSNPDGRYCMGINKGYKGVVYPDTSGVHQYNNDTPDTLHSNYETYFDIHYPNGSHGGRQNPVSLPLPFNPWLDSYFKLEHPDTAMYYCSIQARAESDMYRDYYRGGGMMYSANQWVANVWCGSEYWYLKPSKTLPNRYFVFQSGGDRPKTGEEIRFIQTLPLLLGAKGLMLYYMGSAPGNGVYFPTHYTADSIPYDLSLGFWIGKPGLNLQGEALLRSEAIGGDWINRRDSTDIRWKDYIIAQDYYLQDMNTDIDHLYLGMKSTRVQTGRSCNWLYSNGSELMSLRLQAWCGKGFTRMYNQTPLHDSTDKILGHFVSYLSIPTRPLGRVDAQGKPYYENAIANLDSSFVDVTLLKKDSLSMDSVFYIGVQNRRTDPLWREAGYAGGNMVFIPLADWDSLMAQGGRSWKDTTFKDSTWWRQKFWARQGCREIVIPFNYTHPDNQPRLLHVQQVGGTLDTIVRQNAPLALRFEPGEGKLLRITVQPARASIAQGNLNNSNQRKMVCFPIMRAVGGRLVASDSLRYHLVYHRFDSLAQRLNVYYRRSVPYSQKQTHTPGLEWEGEVNLSANPILKLDNRVATYSCGYPTLVVRQDTVDLDNTTIPPSPTIKVYVVYACADPDAATKFRIVENVFQAQSAAPNYYPAREIDSAWGRERSSYNSLEDDDFLSKWAAPSINACYNGNYYAWADSALGIVTRWKAVGDFLFNAANRDKNSVRYRDDLENTICQHPALNTYSRLGLGENDCALVWEERLSPEAPAAYIPYTRVKLMPGVVPLRTGYFLPLHRNPRLDLQNKTRPDSMVVLMNTDTVVAQQTFPVVYRGVEEYIPANNGSRPLEIVQWDRVAWEVQNEVIKGIELRGVDAADSNYATSPPGDDYWAVWFPTFVWSNTRNLLSPQLAQGGRAWLAPDSLTNISDSAVVLNFHSWRQLGDTPGDFTLWQFQYGYWSSLIRWFVELDQATNIAAYQPNISIVGGGRNPRLSASLWKPGIALAEQNWLYNLWNDNRRVYQAPFLASSSIFSSAENFYKQHAEEEDHPLHYAGYVLQRDSGRAFKTLLSQVNAGGKDLLFRVQPSLQNGNMTLKTDTIYSDWFRAGNTTKLRAFTLGVNNPCVRVQVQRRKENGNDRGERFELPYLAAGNDTAKRRNSFTLLRGGNKLYRLALINTCGNNANSPRYTEEIQLDGLTAADREADLAKGGSETDLAIDAVIDLGDVVQGNDVLALQPNPANEKVTLRFDGLPDDYEDTHYNYELGIYTQLGQRVYSGSISAGESQTITTSGLLPGVYRVQVRGSRGAVSLPMVIMR